MHITVVERNEEWGVMVDGRLCSPRWPERGPAQAYADMVQTGNRRPEFVEHIPGGGTIIENPDRERIMLTTWKAAIRLEQAGIMVRRGKKVMTMAKAHFSLGRAAHFTTVIRAIEDRLTELGYNPRDVGHG
jgi:hypothetical protein